MGNPATTTTKHRSHWDILWLWAKDSWHSQISYLLSLLPSCRQCSSLEGFRPCWLKKEQTQATDQVDLIPALRTCPVFQAWQLHRTQGQATLDPTLALPLIGCVTSSRRSSGICEPWVLHCQSEILVSTLLTSLGVYGWVNDKSASSAGSYWHTDEHTGQWSNTMNWKSNLQHENS